MDRLTETQLVPPRDSTLLSNPERLLPENLLLDDKKKESQV
jgi:hypothetical protein